jgi:hypothetical protein
MKQGGVSSRVALLLRSTEPQPSLLDLSFHCDPVTHGDPLVSCLTLVVSRTAAARGSGVCDCPSMSDMMLWYCRPSGYGGLRCPGQLTVPTTTHDVTLDP